MAEHTLKVDVESTAAGGGGFREQTATLRENIHTLKKFSDGGKGAVSVVRSLSQLMQGNLQRGMFGLAGTFGRLAGPTAVVVGLMAGLGSAIKSAIADIAQAINTYHSIANQGFQRRQNEFYSGIMSRKITQEDVDQARERQENRKDQIDSLRKQMTKMEAEARRNISRDSQALGWWGGAKDKVMGWFGAGSKDAATNFQQRYDDLKTRLAALEKAEQMDQRIVNGFKAPKAAEIETRRTNFLDDMSRMGLYMSTSFAKGGGLTEVDILKEQKDLLQKIADNTADNAAVYSD